MNKIKKYSLLIITALFWAFVSSAVDFYTVDDAMIYVNAQASKDVASQVQTVVAFGFEGGKSSFSDKELDQLIGIERGEEKRKRISPEEDLLRSKKKGSQVSASFIDKLKQANAVSLRNPDYRTVAEKLPQGCSWVRSLSQGNEFVCPFLTVYNALKIQEHFFKARKHDIESVVDYSTYSEDDFYSFLKKTGVSVKANESTFMGDQPQEDALVDSAAHFGIRNFYTLSDQGDKGRSSKYVLNFPGSMVVEGSEYVEFMLRKIALRLEPIFIASVVGGEKHPRHWLLYVIMPYRRIILMDSANEDSIPTRMPIILNQLEFLSKSTEEKERPITCIEAVDYVTEAADDSNISQQKCVEVLADLKKRHENGELSITPSALFKIMGMEEKALLHKRRPLESPAAGGGGAHTLVKLTDRIAGWVRESVVHHEVRKDGHITVKGPVSKNDFLFKLRVTEFKKGDVIELRGSIKSGVVGFGLLSSNGLKWKVPQQSTTKTGAFTLVLRVPETDSYIPVLVDRSSPEDNTFECEFAADISVN